MPSGVRQTSPPPRSGAAGADAKGMAEKFGIGFMALSRTGLRDDRKSQVYVTYLRRDRIARHRNCRKSGFGARVMGAAQRGERVTASIDEVRDASGAPIGFARARPAGHPHQGAGVAQGARGGLG